MTELTPRAIDNAVRRIMLIVAKGKQKTGREQVDSGFAERSRAIEQMRAGRTHRGRGGKICPHT